MKSRVPEWMSATMRGMAAFALVTVQGSVAAQWLTPADQRVTLTGCIQREADYRRMAGAGAGGAANTGAGVANEFVLASVAYAKAGATAPVGTSGGAKAYELSGSNEGQAAAHVGKRVEITGKLKPAETGATGSATGGATANVPGSTDLKLQELEISSIREAAGTCPANQ